MEEFAKKTKLPDDLHFKIRQFIENNYHELFSRVDEDQLLHELPTTLREDVLFFRFGGLIEAIEFLNRCPNNEFVWALVQCLRKVKVDKDDVVYQEGDFSEEIYFIKIGQVKLYAKNGISFATYNEGECFGDSDVIFKEPRDGKAMAFKDCLFFSLHRDNLEKLLDTYPDMREHVNQMAEEKKKHH